MAEPLFTVRMNSLGVPSVNFLNVEGAMYVASMITDSQMVGNYVSVDGCNTPVLQVHLDQATCYVDSDKARNFISSLDAGTIPAPLPTLWCEGWPMLFARFTQYGGFATNLSQRDAVAFIKEAHQRGWRTQHVDTIKDVLMAGHEGRVFRTILDTSRVGTAFVVTLPADSSGIDYQRELSPMGFLFNFEIMFDPPGDNLFKQLEISAEHEGLHIKLDQKFWTKIKSGDAFPPDLMPKTYEEYAVYKNAFLCKDVMRGDIAIDLNVLEALISREFWIFEDDKIREFSHQALEMYMEDYKPGRGNPLPEEALVYALHYRMNKAAGDGMINSAQAYHSEGMSDLKRPRDPSMNPQLPFAHALLMNIGETDEADKIRQEVKGRIDELIASYKRTGNERDKENAFVLSLFFVAFERIFSSIYTTANTGKISI